MAQTHNDNTPPPTPSPGENAKKRRSTGAKIARGVLWCIAGLIGLVVLLFALIYVPPVQDLALKIALKQINKGSDMQLSVKQARLTFPLTLTVDSVAMQTPGMGIEAAYARIEIDPSPILRGEIYGRSIQARGADIRIGTPDSTMYLTAALRDAVIDGAGIRLQSQRIDISKITAAGAKVKILMKPDSVPPPATADSVPVNWHITLGEASLTEVDYMMQLEPMIDRLSCTVAAASLSGAEVDMRHNTVKADSIEVSRADAEYIYNSPEYIASYPVKAYVVPDTAATTPWTVTATKVRLTGSRALYALRGHTPPSQAFDPEYIQASEIEIEVDSFRNRATEVHAPVRRISARERCGVPLQAAGLFDMDSVKMQVRDFIVTTPSSRIAVDGMMGMAAPGDTMLITDTPVALRLTAGISNDDLRRLVPYPMTSTVAQLPPYSGIEAATDIDGVASRDITVRQLLVRIPGHIEVSARGKASGLTAGIDRMSADLTLSGTMRNGNFLKPMLLDAKTGHDVNFPPLAINGEVHAVRGLIDGSMKATLPGGGVALTASWNNRNEGYDIDLEANTFPVQSIMPGLGIRDIDATVKVDGNGFDPFAPGTRINAGIDLRKATYRGNTLADATLSATLADGNASLTASSANRDANLTLSADGNLLGDSLRWNIDGDIRNLNLHALGLSPEISEGSIRFSGHATVAADGAYPLLREFLAPEPVSKKKGGRTAKSASSASLPDRISAISAGLNVSDFYWRMPAMTINGNDVLLDIGADRNATAVTLRNHDLDAEFRSTAPAGTLARGFTDASAIIDRCIADRIVRVDSIQRALPPFTLNVSAGDDNLLHNYLLDLDMSFSDMQLHAANDSLITARASLLDFRTGETRLDSLSFNLFQRGRFLIYEANIDNRPGTLDAFARINGKGFVGPEKFGLMLKQQNIQGETGFSFGTTINMPDENTVALRFVPYHPIIGYKEWEVNRDNIITYNLLTRHIDANLNLHNDKSTVEILTRHNESDSTQEALTVNLKDIQLADWVALYPFAPPVKGNLSAQMDITLDGNDLNGKGTVSLADLFYDRQRVGDFNIDLDVLTRPNGALHADASLSIDGKKAMTLSGALNDSTLANPLMLDLRVIDLPLTVANPFLPPGVATLAGRLQGQMDVDGKMTSPVLNGWLAFDSASVTPTMLGTKLTLPSDSIPVVNSMVRFNSFAIKAVNENPLTINGWVDLSDLALMKMDLAMAARNMQLTGSKRVRSADVYGKSFVDLDARVKGDMRYLNVTAEADILPGTNVTYVVPGLTNEIARQSNQDMVKFVNFNDTTAVTAADSINETAMRMNIDARLKISQGSTIGVDLSTDGKNRVQLQADGSVTYSMDYMNDESFTGRININQGFARYTPPLMGEKLFNFEEGSYVAFNGEMMNPVLNIKANDEIKANVSQSGADTRQVTFNVALTVTGTLESMNVAFDLSTPDDLTVENELKAMSPEQRANAAMNLLVTGTYTGPGTKATSGGNPLFSLLESQLNSLAAKTIKGVDLSFGINQLDRVGSASAMNYSYKVSKSLFDDRFKIVVGGNYTTDADADENFSQNLIADISFEYLLNKQGTMYVKLFRHTGYESILEGEITQTGVGFVYKKRIRRIGDIFKFLRPRKKDTGQQPSQQLQPQEAPHSQAPAAPPAESADRPKATTVTQPENSPEK